MKTKEILEQEERNKNIVENTLKESAGDFTLFFKKLFTDDVEWTISGHGPVAGTYNGMTELFEKAEKALFDRFAEPLKVKTLGVWADGDQVFARIKSETVAADGKPYHNGYIYIMTMKDGKVVSGIEWLDDLPAYYDIINRIEL